MGNFFIQNKKVTAKKYLQFIRNTDRGHSVWCQEVDEPRRHSHSVDNSGRPDDPVLGVSWYDAHAYCAYVGGRLPTAEEWERVVMGKSGNLFPWGDYEDPLESEIALKSFLEKKNDEKHELIKSMWIHGPEWTSSKGWDNDKDTRILKGLPSVVLLGENKMLDRKSYFSYLSTLRQPTEPKKKLKDARFRCVFDHQPTYLEQIFKSSGRMTAKSIE